MTLSREYIENLYNSFKQALTSIANATELEQLRIAYLGRSGVLASTMAQLKHLSRQEKQIYGPLLNKLKQDITQAYMIKKNDLEQAACQASLLEQKNFDVTISRFKHATGSLHPITNTMNKIRDIFLSLGYQIIDGPEAENEFYNFQALNIPQDHPARDMWDTLWLNVPGMLLRTHTSSVQIHALETQLPLSVLAMGRVFRHEATDATHDFMFYQAEGLIVDKNIRLSDLLGTIESFCKLFFEKDDLNIRVRPSYFPFVEPGVEIDISCLFCKKGCSVCKKTKYIEVAGAGLVHPHVLQSTKIDPTIYSGFAFGFGIDRLTMLKHAIPDIRNFSSGNIAFLKQF